MGKETYIRIWHSINVDEVKKHLLVVGHLTGDCANCKHVGINYKSEKTCPDCKTEFRYIASRMSQDTRHYAGLVKKIRSIRPDLIFIDFGDFQHAAGQSKALGFFKDE